MQDTNGDEEPVHELWLIYCLLKDAEVDPAGSTQNISAARLKLGRVVNSMNRYERQRGIRRSDKNKVRPVQSFRSLEELFIVADHSLFRVAA